MSSRVASCFHARDEGWVLPRKLHALTSFCVGVVVVLDRWPEGEAIAEQWNGRNGCEVVCVHHQNAMGLPDGGPDGPICEEGRMRQRAWDECLERFEPDFVVLGDADEIPSPSIANFIERIPDHIELVYLRMVNLWQGEWYRIYGPECVWAPECPDANLKGVIKRVRPGRRERYDVTMTRHCRLEPSPLAPDRAVVDHRHIVAEGLEAPVLVHYKFVHWRRWQDTASAGLKKYRKYFRMMGIGPVASRHFWPGQPELELELHEIPLVISAYTEGTPYAAEARRLEATLRSNDVRHLIEGYAPRGSWELNCAFKAEFCYRMRRELVGPICWVDADATFEGHPFLFQHLHPDTDIALHRIGKQTCSGTIWIGDTMGARKILAAWRDRLEFAPHEWDQRALAFALHQLDGQVKVQELPASYCRILDNEEQNQIAVEPPVVVHHQASRTLRDEVSASSTEELLTSLPRPIAVVGNGPCEGLGELIDAYGSVIRINNFELEGYEEHVGARLSAWCTNCWHDVPHRRPPAPTFTVFHSSVSSQVTEWRKRHNARELIEPEQDWSALARMHKPKPSTGLILLVMLRRLGIEHRPFGFDGLASGHYWDPDHEHDHGDEAAILRRWYGQQLGGHELDGKAVGPC